jgi:hypothetical protein
MEALRKCSHGHLKEFFSSPEEEMGLHLEISQIRLARKANGRVQHLSSGHLPLAGFEVTTEDSKQRCCTQCTQEVDQPSVVSAAQVIENLSEEWRARGNRTPDLLVTTPDGQGEVHAD